MKRTTPREILGFVMHIAASILVTFIIVCVMGLLLWSNITTSAWVRLYFDIEWESVDLLSYDEDVYDFSIGNSVVDLWDAETYGLAILVLCFSLIWPYLKLIFVTICVWISMRAGPRGKALIILDQLGKFSLLDVFILVFMINALHQEIDTSGTFGSDITIDVTFEITVEPDTGIIAFSCAVLFSMLLTLLVKYLHNKHSQNIGVTLQHTLSIYTNETTLSSNTSQGAIPPSPKPQESTTNVRNFETVDRGCCLCCPESLVLRAPIAISMYTKCKEGCGAFIVASIKRIIMLIILVICVLSTILTFSTNFIKVEYTGVIADYINNSTRYYSFRDFGIIEASNTDYTSYATWLAFVYEITVVLFPVLTNCLLIALWFIPLPNFIYRKLRPILWNVHAWSCIDVMFIMSIAVTLEFETLYNWIIDEKFSDYCDDLESYLSEDCADVSVTMLQGTWYALISCITMWISVIYGVYYTDPEYTFNEGASDYIQVETANMDKKQHDGYDTDEEDLGVGV